MGSFGSSPAAEACTESSQAVDRRERGECVPRPKPVGDLTVIVSFATTGETHSTVVLPADARVSELVKELDSTSADALGSRSSFLRGEKHLALEDPISTGDGCQEVGIELVVRSLVGRWRWTKGAKPDTDGSVHDYESHILLLRGDGRAQFNQYHSWLRDNENYGSKRTIIGCQDKGNRDELSGDFLTRDGEGDGGVWEIERDPEPTLCVSGQGFISAGIIEDDDLVAHGAGEVPHEVFAVTLRELWANFDFSVD
mmetsp:Transcript_6054/g.11035  ORF Transcript_6054/g.11035 Transcript_6054/m.11035 type:complete len:255 (-) Transcript_6054:92-856(-)